MIPKRSICFAIAVLIQCSFYVNGFAENTSAITADVQTIQSTNENEQTEVMTEREETEFIPANEIYPYEENDWQFKDIGDSKVPGRAHGYKL